MDADINTGDVMGPTEPSVETLFCDNCGKNTMTALIGHPHGQGPDNVLWVTISGGYGQFVDLMPEQLAAAPKRAEHGYSNVVPPRSEWTDEEVAHYEKEMTTASTVVLCHECAHALCDTFPAFDRLIGPYNSHSHTSQYHDKHPDHYGWDYDTVENSE